MASLETNKIIDNLLEVLPQSRYIHTLGVAYTATSLAMVFGESIDKARLAGLLHDCAKAYSLDDMLEIAKDNNVNVTDLEYKSANLLHAKIGAVLAKIEYGVEDKSVLDAIMYHTTGKPAMTTLEKIIYIADYIEPSRNKQKRLELIRNTAFKDLDQTMLLILEDTMDYLKATNTDIDPLTEETYLFYKENT
ncbi:MAG: bis(5'-nucleosyl)-tetraphosphatase (symmetrical) YqeK [Lachnospiraceae bacterium]|nr:bis(5'-nucleosyl)-tetraphosphatase (symmetrical) YqeK [Lachnospiraceae bacterium]